MTTKCSQQPVEQWYTSCPWTSQRLVYFTALLSYKTYLLFTHLSDSRNYTCYTRICFRGGPLHCWGGVNFRWVQTSSSVNIWLFQGIIKEVTKKNDSSNNDNKKDCNDRGLSSSVLTSNRVRTVKSEKSKFVSVWDLFVSSVLHWYGERAHGQHLENHRWENLSIRTERLF